MKLSWLERTVATNLTSLRQFRHEQSARPGPSRYTQAALARELGIDARTYGDLEKGDSRITLGRLFQLARYLDVSPLDLVVPAVGEGGVLVPAAQGTGQPAADEKVPVDIFVRWWRGHSPLPSQHRYRWMQGRGWRRSDIGFADVRYTDPQARVDARDPADHAVVGRELELEPVELPERQRAAEALGLYWDACDAGDEDAVDRAFDGILEALHTGLRRAQGDDNPEAPIWAGRRLPMVGDA